MKKQRKGKKRRKLRSASRVLPQAVHYYGETRFDEIFKAPVSTFQNTKSLHLILPKRASLIVISILLIGLIVKWEFETSFLQSKFFHTLAYSSIYEPIPGQGEILESPQGPFDKRYGYTLLPSFKGRLINRDYIQSSHTKVSRTAKALSQRGLYLPYDEKQQAGLIINDHKGRLIHTFKEPTWLFEDFSDLSSIIVNTLLFIENKSLLSPSYPTQNPAIEWTRFFKAIIDLASKKITGKGEVPGGSTLATQMEKFKHSPEGLTLTPRDKLTQMFSASLRAYSRSTDTTLSRRRIALDYINTVPLAAVPGYGEIHGLGDGLWAYYGTNPVAANALLKRPISNSQALIKEQAKVYRQILSLFLAHRRPSDYLDETPEELHAQVDKYLPLLFREGIIPYQLYRHALAEKSYHRRRLPAGNQVAYSKRKGPNVIRTQLLSLLGVPSLYELDRYDMQVSSTLDIQAQEAVSRVLLELNTPQGAKKHKLNGFRLLEKDPSKVILSMTLFEKSGSENLLRIQTDTYNQPFNINEGVKLDLGSTAKFRMLVTYLEAMEDVYLRLSRLSTSKRKSLSKKKLDRLTRWGLQYITANPDTDLETYLDASLDRMYSASPKEKFFTAGGIHTFSNFNSKHNNAVLPLREALRHSVNLPFIRMTKDLVQHFGYVTEGSTYRSIDSMKNTTRENYLNLFADHEGKVFIRKFYKKYAQLTPDEILNSLMSSVRGIPRRFAAVYWFLYPEANVESFIAFMKKHVDHASISRKNLERYFKRYESVQNSITDKAYLARMHPLELWVASFLIQNPKASLREVFSQSTNERIAVYDWLRNSSRKSAQNSRIKIMLEAEAFEEIYIRWKRLGYPLSTLVPSLATSLGTSADRPDALAELMGIILNDGIRNQRKSISEINFAQNTPFGTTFAKRYKSGRRVLSTEVARVAKRALFDVVGSGTAIRLKKGLTIGDTHYDVGGKTGTGDHRYQVFNSSGSLVADRVVNRTATFMFMIGDKYFGVISAFVPGREAAKYRFTSSLPVQILKVLEPALQHLED